MSTRVFLVKFEKCDLWKKNWCLYTRIKDNARLEEKKSAFRCALVIKSAPILYNVNNKYGTASTHISRNLSAFHIGILCDKSGRSATTDCKIWPIISQANQRACATTCQLTWLVSVTSQLGIVDSTPCSRVLWVSNWDDGVRSSTSVTLEKWPVTFQVEIKVRAI